MNPILRLFSCALFALLPLLNSCGAARDLGREITEGAAEVFKREAPNLMAKAAEAAKKYWEENKEKILSGGADLLEEAKKMVTTYWETTGKEEAKRIALELANKAKEAALAEVAKLVAEAESRGRTYVDAKLAEAKNTTLQKLYAQGVTRAQIDSDGDGEVSDDELENFLKTNPLKLPGLGIAGLLFLALSALSKRFKGQDPKPAS